MNVVLVGPLPPPFSGPEMVTQTLLDFCPQEIQYRHVDLSSGANAAKGRWSGAAMGRMVKQGLKLAWTLWAIRRTTGVVHLPLSQSTTGVLRDVTFIQIARLFRYRIIVQFHGGDFLQFYRASKFQWLISRSLRRIDGLLVFHHTLFDQFPFMPRNKLKVLVNPVPGHWARVWPTLPIRPPVSESAPLVILFMGHLSVAKGIVDLMQALSYLPQRKTWELHVAGEILRVERNITWQTQDMNDGWAKALNIIRDHHWETHVHYHGVVSGSEKEALFYGSHVLALPSYSEGLPIVILEAMYAGLAVIASRVGAVPAVLPSAALHDPGDVNQLACLLSNMTPSKARQIGHQNRKTVEFGYSPDQVTQQLRELYQSLDGSAFQQNRSLHKHLYP